jgi:hypothetical protein
MIRRTITIPQSLDDLVRAQARDGESFSAAAVRLIEAGARTGDRPVPRYVGTGEGPGDLSIRAEEYLRDPTTYES